MRAIHFRAIPLVIVLAGAAQAQDEKPRPKLEKLSCGQLKKLSRLGSVYLAGQPGRAELRALKDKHKVGLVVNLRRAEEMRWDEKSFVEGELKLRYVSLPFGGPVPLTDKIIGRFRELLKSEKKAVILVHCASANRVGALWLVARVLDQGVEYDKALAEAKAVGLRSPGLIEKARSYIKAQRPS